jgi:hypothetical protein
MTWNKGMRFGKDENTCLLRIFEKVVFPAMIN